MIEHIQGYIDERAAAHKKAGVYGLRESTQHPDMWLMSRGWGVRKEEYVRGGYRWMLHPPSGATTLVDCTEEEVRKIAELWGFGVEP